jgi:LDH2 family malate/lactate/ureidoglycolate dehydrogenase
MPVIPVAEVEKVALAALRGAGVGEDHARIQCDLLLEAELRGVPSHGLLRLPRLAKRIANGVLDPHTRGRHDWRGPAFLHVDGERGLGPVVARFALDAVMPRAREYGVAVAAIANNNHIAMLAWYAEAVAAEGLVCIALTTSEALVHPWGARRAMIGTNPIAIGVPTAGKPFVIDTATGVVSMGKIHDHAHRGQPLQPGWALDAAGEATLDPVAAKSGAIAPFGGAKGYSLGLAFEMLVVALTGSAIGEAVKGTLDAEKVCNKGDLFIVLDPGKSLPAQALSGYLDDIRAADPAAGFDRVQVPGDRSGRARAHHLEAGLPVADEVWTELTALAGRSAQ